MVFGFGKYGNRCKTESDVEAVLVSVLSQIF